MPPGPSQSAVGIARGPGTALSSRSTVDTQSISFQSLDGRLRPHFVRPLRQIRQSISPLGIRPRRTPYAYSYRKAASDCQLVGTRSSDPSAEICPPPCTDIRRRLPRPKLHHPPLDRRRRLHHHVRRRRGYRRPRPSSPRNPDASPPDPMTVEVFAGSYIGGYNCRCGGFAAVAHFICSSDPHLPASRSNATRFVNR